MVFDYRVNHLQYTRKGKMAKTKFILQGLDENYDHYANVEQLLKLKDLKTCLISVAYINLAGVDLLLPLLKPISEKIQLYIGVRNEITSKQALEKLRDNEIYPICVDTGTSDFIFHPKIYLSCNDQKAELIVGSANFTPGGLIKNIEASTVMSLDLNDKDDQELVESILKSFSDLETMSPTNFIRTSATTDYEEYLKLGILANEQKRRFSSPKAFIDGTALRDVVSKMTIKTRKLKKKKTTRHSITPPGVIETIDGIEINSLPIMNLAWKSKPLSRRDLTIPVSEGTNPTGSMYLNKGDKNQNIDFQHYFRQEVFSNANWTIDSKRPQYERAYVKFRIIVKGVDYGVHELKLSYNRDETSETWKQKNGVTQIHWGKEVKSIVAQENLLDDILYIYYPDDETDIYTIIIESE